MKKTTKFVGITLSDELWKIIEHEKTLFTNDTIEDELSALVIIEATKRINLSIMSKGICPNCTGNIDPTKDIAVCPHCGAVWPLRMIANLPVPI